MGYLARLLGLEGKKALQIVAEQIAARDPATASAAELQEMEAQLDQAGRLIGKLRLDAQREDSEAVDAKKLFDLNVRAAEKLQADLRATSDQARKEALTVSLNALLEKLTSYKTEWDREQGEADEARTLLNEAETAYQDRATSLKKRKDELTNATRQLERSKIQREQAETRAEDAARVAGLRDGAGSMTSALSALENQTAKNRVAAEAAKMKTTALRKPELGSSDDPNIVAALASVQHPALDSGSIDDRLAALTGKAPIPALAAPTEKEDAKA